MSTPHSLARGHIQCKIYIVVSCNITLLITGALRLFFMSSNIHVAIYYTFFGRVSVPRLALQAPHQFKPHRRRSFDSTDSMGLSKVFAVEHIHNSLSVSS